VAQGVGIIPRHPGSLHMSEPVTTIQVGQKVPDFELETFEPSTGKFGKVSMEKLREAKKWTVLFFYPADFTFV
jgi:peroxiredoxin (alkyl hydroperoxide reductase subunit C)